MYVRMNINKKDIEPIFKKYKLEYSKKNIISFTRELISVVLENKKCSSENLEYFEHSKYFENYK